MWIEEKQFPNLIQGWWEESKVEGWAGYWLAIKLKLLKNKIKEWAKENFGEVRIQKLNILAETEALDRKEESDHQVGLPSLLLISRFWKVTKNSY